MILILKLLVRLEVFSVSSVNVQKASKDLTLDFLQKILFF